MKPIAAGVDIKKGETANEDVNLLQYESSLKLKVGEINTYSFDEPIAPHIAAQKYNIEKLFLDIKSIGATSSNALQMKGLRGRDYFKRMAAEYEKYKKSGLLPATYEVIYGHAWNMNKNQNFKTFKIKHE